MLSLRNVETLGLLLVCSTLPIFGPAAEFVMPVIQVSDETYTGLPDNQSFTTTWRGGYGGKGEGTGTHTGIDIAVPSGTEVRAVAGGVVHKDTRHPEDDPSTPQDEQYRTAGFGGTVVIEHEFGGIRYFSVYTHLRDILVSANEVVVAGTPIGESGGSTDLATDPMDLVVSACEDRWHGVVKSSRIPCGGSHLHFQVDKDYEGVHPSAACFSDAPPRMGAVDQCREETIHPLAFLRDFAIGNLVALTGRMTTPRSEHTATAIEKGKHAGKVLIVGGFETGTTNQLATAELFDPTTSTFAATGSMTDPRWGHSAIALDDGRVLVVGGWTSSFTVATDTAEIYDPETGNFTKVTDRMSSRRGDFPPLVKLQDGSVLVLGGTSEGGLGTATASVDRFVHNTNDIKSGQFEALSDLSLSRRAHAVCPLDDTRILVAGGVLSCCNSTENQKRLRSAEIYDVAEGRSELLSESLQFDRAFFSMQKLDDGRCLVAGQEGQAEIFDPSSETFFALQPSASDVRDAQIVVLKDHSALLSGRTGLRVFSPISDNVNSLPDPTTEADHFRRTGHSATMLRDGNVLLAGGSRIGGGVLDTATLFIQTICDEDSGLHLVRRGPTIQCERRPTVTVSATPDKVHVGETSSITWKADGVTSCKLLQHGAKIHEISGPKFSETQVFTITGRTIFKLECETSSGPIEGVEVVFVLPGFNEF